MSPDDRWERDGAESEPWDDQVALPISPEDAAVLHELERLQANRGSWWASLLILGVSVLLFVAAAGSDNVGEQLWLLLLVLAFHELGHWAAMRTFGYRNMRMFFIPFFGAAVSGRHFNVAGWQKAVVALMGPVPGIVVGGGLGIAGVVTGEPAFGQAALLMLLLNGFNLLPLLPLDGGWVLHAILFVRHPVLDVLFRLAAILGGLGLAILLGAWILGAVTVMMLLGLPVAWRVARTARRLRDEGLDAEATDGDGIPTHAALRILAELRTTLPAQTPPSAMAAHVANVFETLNAHPPGVLASLGLLAVYAGSFLAIPVFLFIMVFWGPRLFEDPDRPDAQPAAVRRIGQEPR